MSSSNRAPSKVGKGVKADKSHRADKAERGKGGGGGGDKQQHKDAGAKNEDPSIREKVKLLIDMTQRSEEEVCLALYEADYNAEEAINVLFEDMLTGEWETRVKKKKNRQASAGKKGEKEGDENQPAEDWGAPTDQTGGGGGGGNNREEKEKSRGGRGSNAGGPRLGRGWRGRERHENERNQDDRDRSEFRERRGRSGGPLRGSSGGSGRGRGGGRAGGRYPPRNNRNSNYKPMETWDNSNTWDNSTAANANHAEESWDDFPGADEWSTEEYQGSLADTKVFTPSVAPQIDQISEMPGGVQSIVDHQPVNQSLGQSLQQIGQQSAVQLPSQSPVPPIVGTLTAAQTQYFSQLQQNNDPLTKQYGGSTSTASFPNQSYEKSSAVQSQPYGGSQYVNQGANTYANSAYQSVGGGAYGNVQAEQPPTQQQQIPRTKTQRARVPPPSKIPSSAVEMPGDLNSSIGYLDVQFGALDLIDGGATFDGTIDPKYNSAPPANSLEASAAAGATAPSAANLDLNASNQNASLDAYSPKTNPQSSINSALSQTLSNPDSIPPTSEHLSNLRSSSNAQGSSVTPGATVPSSNLDLGKQAESLSYPQSSTYNTYQSKANNYNSSTYSSTQTTNSYVSNQANAYVNNQSGGSYNPSSGNYQNAYSSSSSYQSSAGSNAFPSISQSNSSYPSNNQSYQQNASQSVYGANSGLNSSSNYGSASTSQYNSYSSSNKLVKDGGYDASSSTSNNSQTTATHVTSSAVLSQTTVGGGSKTSTTLAKSSNSVVSNIPAGMPVMSTPYIMGQVPYFQQPVYSYEEMQLLQQRLPHMTTPYYDMSYQTTPTTLAAVRETALSNVGYSISSDNRFTRADNNASPVPSTLSSQQTSTLSQQQGGHQAAAAAAAAAAQPILAAAAAAGTAPPYFFATAFNTIAPNYQFGTMYTQLPAATNAHGSSNNSQYPKPGTYGSGYGSYDALNQSQEYTKGGYVGNAQGQKGSGGNASSGTGSAGNDLTAMYAKTHALGKVNTYEKQGFHSGTPPPFTGAIHGSQNAGLTPSGTGYTPQVYIPTMAAHQQHHATHLMQQPLHQDSGNSGSQRSQASNQAKAGAKQSYQTSYWNQA